MATDTGAPVVRRDKGVHAGGDRLPVAPRQRRPGLAALALLLILGGGLVSAVLVVRSGDKQAVIIMRHDVAEGHVITLDDLVSAQVSTGGVPYVPWGQRLQVVGSTAGADLRRGTMLNPRAVSKNGLPGPGQGAVPFALKHDQVTDGLQAGDHVRVYYAAPPSDKGVTPKAPSLPQDGVVVKDAVVYGGVHERSDGTISVTLIVNQSEAWLIAQLGRLNAISLVKLPEGG